MSRFPSDTWAAMAQVHQRKVVLSGSAFFLFACQFHVLFSTPRAKEAFPPVLSITISQIGVYAQAPTAVFSKFFFSCLSSPDDLKTLCPFVPNADSFSYRSHLFFRHD